MVAEPPGYAETMAKAQEVFEEAVKRAGREGGYDDESSRPDGSLTGLYDHYRLEFNWIIPAFERALAYAPTVPDIMYLDDLIDSMQQAEKSLMNTVQMPGISLDAQGNVQTKPAGLVEPDAGDSSDIAGQVAEWSGDAADNFRKNFLGSLRAVPLNHATTFRVLQGGIRAIQGVYASYLTDVMTIAERTVDALKGERAEFDLHGALELAASLAKITVGLATIEEGGGFEVAAGGIELAVLLTEGGEKGGDELSIGSGTAEAILEASNTALNTLLGHLTDRERELTSNFDDNNNTVLDNPKFFTVFEPAATSLAHKPASALWNEFD